MKWVQHLKTVRHHRRIVRRYCFRLGLYRQGLCHDLSKFSPVEFLPGVRYFQGSRSPNEAERQDKGYSAAWLHHKGRNKHHLEYWIDYSVEPGRGLRGMKMPGRYVAEMFCDRIAASRTYRRELYQDSDPWDYYERSKGHYLIHPETQALLEKTLLLLRDEGEEAAFAFIRREVLPKGEKRRR